MEEACRQCPEDAPWKEDFDAAFKLAGEARWSEAEAKLTALVETAPQSSAVWRNLAKAARLDGRYGRSHRGP